MFNCVVLREDVFAIPMWVQSKIIKFNNWCLEVWISGWAGYVLLTPLPRIYMLHHGGMFYCRNKRGNLEKKNLPSLSHKVVSNTPLRWAIIKQATLVWIGHHGIDRR